MKKKSLPLPEKLIAVAAKDYPGAEIGVSFPKQWELVQAFKSNQARLYVASLPPSQERTREDRFLGLPPEINRSFNTYRQYKLFEPWPQPIIPVAWDEAKGEGRVLAGGRLRVQLQPLGQAQIWKGDTDGLVWECYFHQSRQQRENWQMELTTFWQAVERDMGVKKIFTQPYEPTFEQGYRDFLSHLGYTSDPNYERWWSKQP